MTDRKRTILIVSPWAHRWSLGQTGVAAGVSDDNHFSRVATAAGYNLHFLAPEGRGDGGEGTFTHTYPNFFRRTAHLPGGMKRLWWPAAFNRIVVPRAVELARNIRADFVLGHSHYSATATFRCRRELGVPGAVKLFGVMDLVHTEWPRWKYVFKNFEQLRALRYPQDAWIVLDDGTRGDEVIASRGVPREKIHFLPNGIDLGWLDQTFDGDAARERFAIPRDAVAVLFLARLVASKRPSEFVRAIPRACARSRSELVFVVAGDGPERAAAESLADRLGVRDRARFVGVVPRADVPHLMAASDLFVTTSSLTNMAIPTCEAFVCGRPVVAYDVGDTGKVVSADTGMLIPDADNDALADGMVALADDPGLRHRLGENARRFARENFTGWDERIRMELDVIEDLIARG